MTSSLRQRLLLDLQLAGLSERTQETREGLLKGVEPSVWDQDWVVHLSAGRRRPEVVAVPGAVRLPGGDRRSSNHLLRRWPGDPHVSPCGVEAAAEDDARRDGVPPPVLGARAAVGVPEGSIVRVPQPGRRSGAGAGAVADRAASRVDVPAPSPSGRGAVSSCPDAGLRSVRRCAGAVGVRAGAVGGGLGHEQGR